MADDLDVNRDDRPITSRDGRTPPGARSRWLRRALTLGIALTAVGGFAAIVLNVYDGGQPADEKAAPVLRADGGPTKIRPDQPGGMDVPNQDKQVYGRIAPIDPVPPVERLIAPPEATVARPPPPQAAEPPPVEMPAPATAEPSAETPPMRMTEPVPEPPPPPPPPPAAVAPPPPPAAKAPPPKAAAPAPPPAASAAASAPRAAASGGYRVQIASVRSEDAAKRAWTELSKRHGDLFGSLRSSVVRADLGPKGVYWRVQAGPLASAAAAQALCDRAKQRKIGCIIVRP